MTMILPPNHSVPNETKKDNHFWQHHFQQYQTTGLSKAAYAKQHQLAQHRFAYWCRKFENLRQPSAKPTPGFVPVTLKSDHDTTDLTLLGKLRLGTQVELLIYHETAFTCLLEAWKK